LGALGSLGVGAVVIGVIVAVDEGNATPILITGVALVIVALVGRQWEELHVSYRDQFEGTIRRGAAIGEAAAKVEEVAASPDLPPSFKQQLESIRRKLEQIQEATGDEPRIRLRPSRRWFGGGAITEYVAWHEIHDDGVDLMLMRPEADRSIIYCKMIAPDGKPYLHRPRQGMGRPAKAFRVRFPADFASAPLHLPKGDYTVSWEMITGSGGEFSVAEDSFSIAGKGGEAHNE
jgi:hypothetical protein